MVESIGSRRFHTFIHRHAKWDGKTQASHSQVERRHPRSHKPSQTRVHIFTPAAPTLRSATDAHTGRWPHAFAHRPPLLLTPRQARRTPGRRAHVPPVLGPARPRTRSGSHTPAFPVPACFSGNCPPLPSPQAGSARCIFSLSGFRPFPPSACLRPAPSARGVPRPPASPPSFQRGFPAAGGAADFPAGSVGSGQEPCPELPPRPGPVGGGRSRAAKPEAGGGSDTGPLDLGKEWPKPGFWPARRCVVGGPSRRSLWESCPDPSVQVAVDSARGRGAGVSLTQGRARLPVSWESKPEPFPQGRHGTTRAPKTRGRPPPPASPRLRPSGGGIWSRARRRVPDASPSAFSRCPRASVYRRLQPWLQRGTRRHGFQEAPSPRP